MKSMQVLTTIVCILAICGFTTLTFRDANASIKAHRKHTAALHERRATQMAHVLEATATHSNKQLVLSTGDTSVTVYDKGILDKRTWDSDMVGYLEHHYHLTTSSPCKTLTHLVVCAVSEDTNDERIDFIPYK